MKFRKIKSKKAALELSIGTIVILVIAMSMLILGLILVRTIFTGAKYNVETMNKKVEAEINGLFVDDDVKAVLYLPNREAEIKQGETFGVGFGIQNVGPNGEFKWKTKIAEELNRKCGSGVNEDDALDWITTGGSNTRGVAIPSGDKHVNIIRFNIPKGSVGDVSRCVVRYQLDIYKDGSSNNDIYTTESFDVVVNG